MLLLPLQFSLFAEVGVLEAEKVEHTILSYGVDALFGIGYDAGFGMEGNA